MAGEISRPFGRAVQAMIEAVLPGKDVYYAQVTRSDANLTYPYVVIWPIPTERRRANLTGSIVARDSRLQLTGVGTSPDEVAWVLDRAGDALHGKRVHVDGYRSGLMWEMPVEQPISKNEDLWTPSGSPTYRGVSMYRLSSEPRNDAGS